MALRFPFTLPVGRRRGTHDCGSVNHSVLGLALLIIGLLGSGHAVSQSLNPSGLKLANDDAIYDHIASRNLRDVYDVARLLDRLGDPQRARRAARSAAILSEHRADIAALCDERGINPFLAAAVIAAESAGHSDAVSPVGAAGLMQIMPGTADDLDVLDRKRSSDSIFGGCRYLAEMRDAFDDDELLMLAAYNAGPGAVRKHGGVPPFRETRRYIISVARSWPELTTD